MSGTMWCNIYLLTKFEVIAQVTITDADFIIVVTMKSLRRYARVLAFRRLKDYNKSNKKKVVCDLCHE